MMKRISPMYYGFARCLAVAGLSSFAFLACGSDTPGDGGNAGTSSGGSAAGNQTGGSSPTAGTNSAAGTQSSAGTAGATSSGGGGAGGGASAGSGGAGGATGGGGAGGSGGASGGGGAGGGAAVPTAVANIMGLNGMAVTGTATFTQGATTTKLVLNLTACPNGLHASHLHAVKDCGDNGMAAGGHWVPNGEGLGDYTCADTKGTLTVEKPIATWTVGDASATDVTKYSFMVHEDTAGPRIGCGLIDKK
jgi:hypothetical protein